VHDGSADKDVSAKRHESRRAGRAVPHEAIGDGELLTILHEAFLARKAVPPEFIQVAQKAYAWHNVDYELAQLTYDSPPPAGTTRAETASIRAMVFCSPHLIIDLEVANGVIIGQLVPTCDHPIEIQITTGANRMVTIDTFGCFEISPIPHVPFRLHCQTADGTDVRTGWIIP
jgi:hypothetical protein